MQGAVGANSSSSLLSSVARPHHLPTLDTPLSKRLDEIRRTMGDGVTSSKVDLRWNYLSIEQTFPFSSPLLSSFLCILNWFPFFFLLSSFFVSFLPFPSFLSSFHRLLSTFLFSFLLSFLPSYLPFFLISFPISLQSGCRGAMGPKGATHKSKNTHV